MDRLKVYPNQLLTDAEILQTEKNAMLGIGHLARAILGTSTEVAGLACSPTAPASMSVQVGPGSIYALTSVDATAYGSLGADTVNQIVKQGISTTTLTLACPAPTTAGQSVVYLIQAGYVDQDTGSTILTYFNSTNPSQPFTGPDNSGDSQPTMRQGICSVQIVPGTAAATGSASAPAVSNGYVPLYTVTVPYGATTVTTANIAPATSSPVLGYTLPSLIASTLKASNNLSDLGSLAAALTNLGFVSGTGYFKIPGILSGGTAVTLFQYGQVVVSGNGSTSVTFPMAFPNAIKAIVSSPYLTSASAGSAAGFIGFSTPTLTGFTAYNGNANQGADNWLAIGN